MTTRSETVIVALDGAGRLPIDTSGEMKLPGVNVVSIPSDGLALDTLELRPDIWVIEVGARRPIPGLSPLQDAEMLVERIGTAVDEGLIAQAPIVLICPRAASTLVRRLTVEHPIAEVLYGEPSPHEVVEVCQRCI